MPVVAVVLHMVVVQKEPVVLAVVVPVLILAVMLVSLELMALVVEAVVHLCLPVQAPLVLVVTVEMV